MRVPADAARRMLELLPNLAHHVCVNDNGDTFGDEIAGTEAAHLLEHTIIELQNAGHEPIAFDNLCNASPVVFDRIEAITGKSVEFVEGDIRDEKKLSEVFAAHDIDCVIHFAGLKAVGESVHKPIEYYDNNVGGTVKLLEEDEQARIRGLIINKFRGDVEILRPGLTQLEDLTGKPVIGDIAKMPHMLIAGTTGSGKSVCINSMLISLLYKSTPEEVRLIMVDPKMVELGNYNGIPHLLIPVVTDPKKAAGALNWAVGEMERRYKLFADHQVRNLVGYNDLMRSEKAKAEQTEDGHPEQYQVLPQIVIVIDELADLMMVAAKEVENSICRIAQKARAAGMHLVVATQRPSSDVITGIMKANIPSRIAFAVASQIESRIILDTTGAEKLIGKGDMLYAPLGEGKPLRVQGCFISNEEIESVIEKIKETSTAEYSEEILEHIERQAEQADSKSGGSAGDPGEDEDEMIEEAIDVIMESRQASTSMLQRRLKLGYSRAARIIDQIEERGIIGPFEGSKPRQILISREEWQEMKLRRNMPIE